MEPTSAIIPSSLEQAYTSATAPINVTKLQSMFPDFDTESLDNITPKQVYAMENLYGLNYKKEIELVSDIPCALFKKQTPIPPHTPINLIFPIDSNIYHISLINYAGAFATADVKKYYKPSSDSSKTSNNSQNDISRFPNRSKLHWNWRY